MVCNQLSIGYQSKRGTHVVASDINATINQGELTCLLGPNGVGKSTLLRTLAGFQPPLSGTIAYPGLPSTQPRHTAQLSRLVSIVLTERPDVRNMNVSELVALGRSPYTGFWGRLTTSDKAIIAESINLVGIQSLAHRPVSTLSDGERQKVMIAKALAQQTPIIYLDEPTAFLDYPSKIEMMQLLRRLAHSMNKVIFLSTHDVELALKIADTLWLMQGDGLHIGTPRQLAADGSLTAFIERPGITFDRQSFVINIC